MDIVVMSLYYLKDDINFIFKASINFESVFSCAINLRIYYSIKLYAICGILQGLNPWHDGSSV